MSGTQRRSAILGTGSELPSKVVTNRDLEKMVDTSDEWITVRTGIKERRVLEEGKGNADMAFQAAKRALEDAGMEAKDLDAIIMGTVSRTILFPAPRACWKTCSARATCFLFRCRRGMRGISQRVIGGGFVIRSGKVNNALVVGSDALSRIAQLAGSRHLYSFRRRRRRRGLGASENGSGILSTKLRTDGSYVKQLYVPAGGSLKPARPRKPCGETNTRSP